MSPLRAEFEGYEITLKPGEKGELPGKPNVQIILQEDDITSLISSGEAFQMAALVEVGQEVALNILQSPKLFRAPVVLELYLTKI